MYTLTLTGTLPRQDAEPLIMHGVCDASDVLKVFDNLLERATEHRMEDIRIKFQGHTYESRAEFLDMIFTINAYSTAHNGTKIFM